jgi:hypothetical protein
VSDEVREEREAICARILHIASGFGGYDDTCACVGDLLELYAELMGVPYDEAKRRWRAAP